MAQIDSGYEVFNKIYDSVWKMKDVSREETSQLVDLMDSIANFSKDPNQLMRVMQMRAFLSISEDVKGGLKYVRQAIGLTNKYNLHQYDGHLFYVAGALFKGSNLDSATYYLETAYHLSQIERDSATMKNALIKMSFVAMEQADYVKALKYLQTSERFFSGNSTIESVRSKINQSHALSAVGLEERAIVLTQQGIQQAVTARYVGYEIHVINLYGNQIESLLKLNKPLQAYESLRKMSEQIPKLDQFPEYSNFMLTVGEMYLALDSATLAIKNFMEAESHSFYSYRKLSGMFNAYKQLRDHKNAKSVALTLINRIPNLISATGKTETLKIAGDAFE